MIVFTAGLCRIGGFIGCSFIMERNMVDDYCLVGHVFANFSAAGVTECYKTCQTNCRCVSFNFLKSINQSNCQLNEENRHTKPGALKPMNGSQYYDLVIDYEVTVRHKIFRHHPSPTPTPTPPPPTPTPPELKCGAFGPWHEVSWRHGIEKLYMTRTDRMTGCFLLSTHVDTL